jgi:glycine cleavage system H protein
MNFPKDFLYTKEHEWIKVEGSNATVGISAFAVEQLGDVVHVELPKVGQKFKQGDTFGSVESTKTVSDLYMPGGITVTEINANLKNAPEKLSEDPHGKFWLVKGTVDAAPQGLLDAAAYDKYIADEASHH